MKCINEGIIQAYIDGELSNDEVVQVEQHIQTCSLCMSKLETQQSISKQLKMAINSMADNDINIPVFSQLKSMGSWQNARRKKIVLTVSSLLAAASIALLVFLFSPESAIQKQDHVSFYNSFDYEIDANQPLTQQAIIIHVIDVDGNHADFILE